MNFEDNEPKGSQATPFESNVKGTSRPVQRNFETELRSRAGFTASLRGFVGITEAERDALADAIEALRALVEHNADVPLVGAADATAALARLDAVRNDSSATKGSVSKPGGISQGETP